MLTDLPVDILECILEYINAESLLELSRVSRFFYNIANDEYVWKKKCFDQFNIAHDIAYRKAGWRRLYLALRNPRVYTWGRNDDFRLGLKSTETSTFTVEISKREQRIRAGSEVAEPQEVYSLRGKGIVDIVSGGWSFHALDRFGYVWFWGIMHSFNTQRSIGADSVKIPTKLQTRVPDEHKVKFKSVASGRGHAIGLAQDGSVWHWSNCHVIQKVNLLSANNKVVQVTANWSYSSVLTEDGTIFIVPHPLYVSRMDIQNDFEPILAPTVVSMGVPSSAILQDPKDQVIQICGLDNYTMALTKYGRVLKLATKNDMAFATSPEQFVTFLTHFSASEREVSDRRGQVKRFITGSFESFAVYTDDDRVLLGSIHSTQDSEPRRLPGLDHKQVCKVSFGDYHYGALTSKGEIMTWGNYSSGALGHGANNQDLRAPQYVESLKHMYTFAIGFGGWQSSALVINVDE
ncbi:RCC1/BLIP-II protein [Rhizopus microsporus var. microsporus]|uniref:RCC1/BLIP-II protein n=1 Tax=Rhizopus microsporus var. microsporus TaxID=86635 RepID=A0A1X0RD08_RHIZD|nr:RCC1/BLIP-II protein [Rhizopus microsporus var. microsporus]